MNLREGGLSFSVVWGIGDDRYPRVVSVSAIVALALALAGALGRYWRVGASRTSRREAVRDPRPDVDEPVIDPTADRFLARDHQGRD
ncbi:MAG: hypothetical protein ACOCS7_03045 [Halolamina sp.]